MNTGEAVFNTITRGTTPTLVLDIGLPIVNISILHLSFLQGTDIRLLKTLEDAENIGETGFELTLTQEDTLGLKPGTCNIQARIVIKGVKETSLVTNVFPIKVLDIQEDGVLRKRV